MKKINLIGACIAIVALIATFLPLFHVGDTEAEKGTTVYFLGSVIQQSSDVGDQSTEYKETMGKICETNKQIINSYTMTSLYRYASLLKETEKKHKEIEKEYDKDTNETQETSNKTASIIMVLCWLTWLITIATTILQLIGKLRVLFPCLMLIPCLLFFMLISAPVGPGVGIWLYWLATLALIVYSIIVKRKLKKQNA